jgi:hypothetical protein
VKAEKNQKSKRRKSMNNELNLAIQAGLVRCGLAKAAAEITARRTLAEQPDEWKRIADRCKRGEISKVYLFTVPISESQPRTFVYAPGKVDNSAHLKVMLSQGPDIGCEADEPCASDEPRFGYHKVEEPWEIGQDVIRALQGTAR